MELYIVRHGQSFNNAIEASSGERVCDPPLTELGEAQAKLMAAHLKEDTEKSWDRDGSGYGITRIFCSAMLRAMQTAAPIAEALGMNPDVWIDVHEQQGLWLDGGDGRGSVGYPGLTRGESEEWFPGYILPEEITDSGWWNRPVETQEQWTARADRVAVRLRGEFAGTDERIAVVTHGGFTNSLLHALFHTGESDGVYYGHHNTAISRIGFQEDERLGVRYLNRVDHLPQDLIT